ncbi:MAG: zinc-binding dehydrogenase, partial [Bacteroidota bacterium]
KVIDYTTTDFTRTGDTYDVIYDTIGKSSFNKSKNALKPNGIYMSPVLKLPLLFQMIWTSSFGKKKAKFSATGLLPKEEFVVLLKWVREGFSKGQLEAIIDKSYPLEAIREAHQYVDTGRKRGNIVLIP